MRCLPKWDPATGSRTGQKGGKERGPRWGQGRAAADAPFGVLLADVRMGRTSGKGTWAKAGLTWARTEGREGAWAKGGPTWGSSRQTALRAAGQGGSVPRATHPCRPSTCRRSNRKATSHPYRPPTCQRSSRKATPHL
eukprot:354165-Chlamydomonas_euryale.AAC.2